MRLTYSHHCEAAAEGRSLTALIEEGLRTVVKERAAVDKVGRILPPASTATGGLLPRISLNEAFVLQEIDDMDSVARLR
jgi:hypothetical protein